MLVAECVVVSGVERTSAQERLVGRTRELAATMNVVILSTATSSYGGNLRRGRWTRFCTVTRPSWTVIATKSSCSEVPPPVHWWPFRLHPMESCHWQRLTTMVAIGSFAVTMKDLSWRMSTTCGEFAEVLLHRNRGTCACRVTWALGGVGLHGLVYRQPSS